MTTREEMMARISPEARRLVEDLVERTNTAHPGAGPGEWGKHFEKALKQLAAAGDVHAQEVIAATPKVPRYNPMDYICDSCGYVLPDFADGEDTFCMCG
ncbi:hypothetical protein ACFXDJ_06935 [Streptomyces sp. NPDC059443]|uniref:hypothetical protein n=1 Tax=unclassified Streptomyces TaxID=2593676 RepID=UPI003681F762